MKWYNIFIVIVEVKYCLPTILPSDYLLEATVCWAIIYKVQRFFNSCPEVALLFSLFLFAIEFHNMFEKRLQEDVISIWG